MDAEAADAGGRGAVALTAALAAACFVQRVRHSLPRPAAQRRGGQGATEVDRFSLAAMARSPRCAWSPAIFPGVVIDALKPVALAVDRRGDAGAGEDRRGCRSRRSPRAAAPTTACWSSCSSPLPARWPPSAIHRLASDALRRAPAWDCGFPEPSPATQYTAESFSQPIRRVFGGFVFRGRERARHAGARARRARRSHHASRCAIRSGTASTRRSASSSARSRRGSTGCSSSPSGNI